jgi:GTP pyrophosphokinase
MLFFKKDNLNPKEIFDYIKGITDEDKERIKKALDFATVAHEGQKRFSGEPYITHPFEVAKILAEMNVSTDMIIAGLLHDTLEDTATTKEEINANFGPNILFLIEGVTKLGKIKYQGATRHTESLRKLFVAMAEDIRVILIKLADRLHNVRTLEHVRPDKRQRIALETIEIYAPIANRLGIWKIKGMLEDASFQYAFPEEYKTVVKLRKTKGKESLKRIEKVSRTLQKVLAEHNLRHAQIDYRIKYLFGLYKKLQKKNMDIDQIYDLLAMRVIVDTIPECYQVLGIIHNLWRPVPGRLHDYIGRPKENGYQSIHTDIFTPDGSMAEIQIRTTKMHEEAQFGIASHIVYEESGKPDTGGKMEKKFDWIKNLIEWQKNVSDSEEFLTSLKTDFFGDRIFIFTPKGDVIDLPEGASALDFAYAIHSDVGNSAHAAYVNNKYSSLDTILKDRQIVKIETKKTNKPSLKWLDYCKTTMAKKHIRSYLQKNTD